MLIIQQVLERLESDAVWTLAPAPKATEGSCKRSAVVQFRLGILPSGKPHDTQQQACSGHVADMFDTFDKARLNGFESIAAPVRQSGGWAVFHGCNSFRISRAQLVQSFTTFWRQLTSISRVKLPSRHETNKGHARGYMQSCV